MSEGDATEQRAEDHGATAPAAATAPPDEAVVHELRPIDNLKICSSCLVQNSATDMFCTACGAEFPPAPAAEEPTTEILDAWPAEPAPAVEQTTVQPPLPVSAGARSASSRRSRILIAALVAALAGLAAVAVMWQMQTQHAHKLSRTLAATRGTLASTQSMLKKSRLKLDSANALSERRKVVLLQAGDVLAKVDPLLSSVDTIQNKAGTVGDQGSTLSSDSETFISTVADLVNYMINNDAAYYDWGWINQQIDSANGELGTIRADEAVLYGDTSAYGSASDKFGTKASAFTQSVRTLEKQLNAAVGK